MLGPEEERQGENGRRMEEEWRKERSFLYKPHCVKLVSAEGFEFIVDRKAAIISNTLLQRSSDTELSVVNFPEISTPILEKVCQYFYWSLQFTRGKDMELYAEPDITLELLMAGNYLRT